MKRVHGEELRQIAQQAAEWFELLPAATLEERQKFLAWLQTSPVHVREFLAAIIIHDELRDLDLQRLIDVEELAAKAHDNVISITKHRRVDTRTSDTLSQPPLDPVAGARQSHAISYLYWGLALLLPTIAIVLLLIHAFTGTSSDRIVTNAAEWRTVALADGSTARIAPNSQLRIDFENRQRTVHLILGEALFDVAQNRDRPFVVDTALGTVTALGTTFGINRLTPDHVIVSVAEGSVAVAITVDSNKAPAPAPSRHATLSAGQQVAIVCGPLSLANRRSDEPATPDITCGWLFPHSRLPRRLSHVSVRS